MSTALYTTLDELSTGIEEMGGLSPEYFRKMQHRLPQATSVQRVEWLCARLTGKTVLHVGCDGPLHNVLLKQCARVYGFDRVKVEAPDCYEIDLDCLTEPLPVFPDVDNVLCAEILEHLGNSRFLLESLREAYPTQQLIVTAPNAFSLAGRQWLAKGYEQVNAEHMWWPSWHTMTRLLEASGYSVKEFLYYNGAPPTSEGLIFVAEKSQ